jgi:integrase/recombinase XerC
MSMHWETIRGGRGTCRESGPPLRNAVEDYLTHLKATGRSAATIESYAGSLAALGALLGSDIPLEDLSADVLETAVAGMNGDGDDKPQRSETTLNRYRSTYRGFGRWAFESGRASRNPAERLRLARVDSPPTIPITPDETRLLLRTIQRSGEPLSLRDEALFSIYAFTGLRRTEALGLSVSDYDTVRRTLQVRNGKGRRVRTVPVVPALGAVLDKLLTGTVCGQERLFPGRVPGRGLTPRQAQWRFEHWKTVAGLRDELTIHSFRAGFATALHKGSGDVVLVSRALGHRDLRPTLRYIELHPRKLRLAMERSLAGGRTVSA